jgi:hypothetical protein
MAFELVPPPVPIANMSIRTPPFWNVDYPAVYGMQNPIVQQRINQSIYSMLLQLARTLQHGNAATPISTAYDIKNNQRDILSILMIGSRDVIGANIEYKQKSMTIDTRTARVYKLSDLFKPGSGYVKTLSKMVADQIKERKIDLIGEFKGIRPDHDYYVADLCLVIYFQQYEIASRPYGFPSFPIPLYSIMDMIPEDGILRRLL